MNEYTVKNKRTCTVASYVAKDEKELRACLEREHTPAKSAVAAKALRAEPGEHEITHVCSLPTAVTAHPPARAKSRHKHQ